MGKYLLSIAMVDVNSYEYPKTTENVIKRLLLLSFLFFILLIIPIFSITEYVTHQMSSYQNRG